MFRGRKTKTNSVRAAGCRKMNQNGTLRMSDENKRRLDKLVGLASEEGVSLNAIFPPGYRLFYRLGLHPRPPVCQSIGEAALRMSVCWLPVILLSWRLSGSVAGMTGVASAAVGSTIGILWWSRRMAAKLNNPVWERL